MTNKQKLNRLISNCDFIEHQEDYDDLSKELQVLEIFRRLVKNEEVWKDIEFGEDHNRLYIDGVINYIDEEEKKLFKEWLDND